MTLTIQNSISFQCFKSKQCICHGYFVKYDNYIYSPANIYNVHAISQYMKLTLWHHTINTALALDKFLIKAPPLMHIKARLGGWGARRRR